MTNNPVEALGTRVRERGSSPLVTHYDLVADTRVELSATTFANWADKTTNLIEDLGLDPGDPIAVPLLSQRPDHWVSLVWAFACWQFGSPVLLDHCDADLVVCGPAAAAIPGRQVISCSLHPLGLANKRLDEAVTDYAEVLAQPDDHWCATPSGIALATVPELRFADLPSADTESGRILVSDPLSPVTTLRALCSVLRIGSLVVALGGNTFDLGRIVDQERVSSG